MVLTVDQQVEVLTLVVSNEALGASHCLCLVCNGVRQDVAKVLPAFRAKRGLPWTSVTSLLENFPKAKRLRFSNQREEALVTELVKGRGLHELHLFDCSGVTDVSALGGCASLHTLHLFRCNRMTDVSALAGSANLHTIDLADCTGVTDVSALAGCASLHTLELSGCLGVTDESALARCASLHELYLSRYGVRRCYEGKNDIMTRCYQ